MSDLDDGCAPAALAAILTPIGEGGIAVVSVVGPGAFDLAGRLFRPHSTSAAKPDVRQLHYGHIVDDGEVVDEVLVRLVPAEDAPGGEATVEVNCHGGVVAVQRVLACFVERGARVIDPETMLARRAASRIAGEAALALTRAATPLAVEALLDQQAGALDHALTELPWEAPARVEEALRELLATERLGRALSVPPRVVLVGPANAGKSTLFNALAREDRVIVCPTPGTTRDAVRAEVALGGIAVWLTDTAGERRPASAIERDAIARSRSSAAQADLVLLVLDASAPQAVPLDSFLAAAERRLLVLNKADLGLAPWARALPDPIIISASRGDGLDQLTQRIVEALVGDAACQPGCPVVFTARQADLIRQALDALGDSRPAHAQRLVAAIYQPAPQPHHRTAGHQPAGSRE